MAEPLEGDALLDFLSKGSRTAKLACVRADGSPVVSPVWFVVDDGELVFTTMNSALKCRAMRRDPRVSICVDDERFPYGFASLQGEATLLELPVDELLPWTTRIAERYVPADEVDRFGARNAVPEEVLVRVSITRAFAFSGVAD